MDASRFAIDTAPLQGSLQHKLQAMSDAGFSRLTLWAQDLMSEQEGGLAQTVRTVRHSGMKVIGFEALRDFEGMSGRFLEYKIDLAKTMMRMMQQVGAELLVVSATTSPNAVGDLETTAAHLRLLSTLATPLGIRIGFEPLAWGRYVHDYHAAWQVVEMVNRQNVGLVLDSFHLFARGIPLDDLYRMPMHKLFLVQLSDAMSDYLPLLEEMVHISRHQRSFPGEGVHSMAVVDMLVRLEMAGYQGNYAFEVANDEFLTQDAASVASRAARSVDWLCRTVSQRLQDSGC
jgi:sugar phosphate isomerase/epimerase